MSFSDQATEYAKAVSSGELVAGPHVRDACNRHLADLERDDIFWDADDSEKAIRFFAVVLRLNGGDFEGKPFILLPWQAFIVGCIFGWKSLDGERLTSSTSFSRKLPRRFRVAYVETGKGSGKSPLAAGIGLKGFVADDEPRAEVYSAATKKDQAMILFRDAVAMVDQSPSLSERLLKSGTGERCWNLAYLEKGSFFRPISSDDGQSGPRPHIGLIDEIHEHKSNVAVEMLRAGTKSRWQALIFMITNSGSNKKGPCWQYHEYGAKVASGMLKDDAFFSFICALDEGDDPFVSEDCWEKVNPSLVYGLPGVKYLREQVVEARGMPSKEAMVRRLNFCQWTDAENPWISADVWLGAGQDYDIQSLKGRRAWGSLDLASTTDLNAMVFFVEPIEHDEPWKIVPFAFLPDDDLLRKQEIDRVPYLAWRDAGYLTTTPGSAISKLTIIKKLVELAGFFDIQSVAFDRWRIEDFIQLAEDYGIPLPEMVPFGQGYQSMSPAIELFETALLNKEVVHPRHPVLTWCFSNAVIVSDDADNRKLSKKKAVGRIDLAVAAVMGAGISLGKRLEEEEIQQGFVEL